MSREDDSPMLLADEGIPWWAATLVGLTAGLLGALALYLPKIVPPLNDLLSKRSEQRRKDREQQESAELERQAQKESTRLKLQAEVALQWKELFERQETTIRSLQKELLDLRSQVEAQSKRLLDCEVDRARLADRVSLLEINQSWPVRESSQCVYSKTLDGVITSWSDGCEKLFGWKAEEVIGQKATDLNVPADQAPEWEGWMKRVALGETVECPRTVRVTKTGQLVLVAVRLIPVRAHSDGRVVGAITYVRRAA
jgi:PAS domain S-box-containing protein